MGGNRRHAKARQALPGARRPARIDVRALPPALPLLTKDLLFATNSRRVDRLSMRERPGKACFRFWQEGPGYDRNLNTPAFLEAAVEKSKRSGLMV
jgi:REP-associated tyrosine transposase